MAILEDLKDKTLDLAQAGMEKSRQFMEIARLNLANAGEENTIRKTYLELGKLYYAQHGQSPAPEYEALCRKITDAQANIERNRARIADIKSTSDISDSETSDLDVAEFPPEDPEPTDNIN